MRTAPFHYDFGNLKEAIKKFEELKQQGYNVRFVISEHEYSLGYWIEDKDLPTKMSDFEFYDVDTLLIFTNKHEYN